jgi:ABC-type antimicrobial peptide transport system permease subunit
VARNVLERRAELGLLRAVGFSLRRLRVLVAVEHLALAAAGVAGGSLSGAVAVLPTLGRSAGSYPAGPVVGLLLALLAGAALWTAAATTLSVRGNLVAALRNE